VLLEQIRPDHIEQSGGESNDIDLLLGGWAVARLVPEKASVRDCRSKKYSRAASVKTTKIGVVSLSISLQPPSASISASTNTLERF
jgi:hypothetical protein